MNNNLNIADDNTSSEMKKLFSQDKGVEIPKDGDLIEGVVVSLGKSEIHIDIPGLTTGVIRGKEIFDESGEASELKKGDTVAAVVMEIENENGEIELSLRQAGHQKAWDNLIRIKDDGEIVQAKITDANRGGLMIRVGNVAGFLPVSQLTVEHYPRVDGGNKNRILEILKSYIKKIFDVKIIDVDEVQDKLIVSEKAAWEEQQKDLISKYKIGDMVEGKVTGVVDFGAFVEFDNGFEGLVHISELAWQRIDDPRQIIHTGDKVKARIIDVQGSKISLSIRDLQEDPWVSITKKYKIGQEVNGKVLKLNSFGAFVRLDDAIHGLAHISELSDESVSDPGDIVKIGNEYTFRILSIEPKNHRLGLTLRKPSSKKLTDNGKSEKDDKKTEDDSQKKQKPSAKKEKSRDALNASKNVEKKKDKKKKEDKKDEKIDDKQREK